MYGYVALMTHFNAIQGERVVAAFGRTVHFKLYYEGNVVADLRLVGSAAAATETAACNRAMQAGALKGRPVCR